MESEQYPATSAASSARDLPPLPRVPATLTISAPDQPPDTNAPAVTVRVPSSKYLTLRYVLAAALAEGTSVVRNPALSDDTSVLVRCLRALGVGIAWERLSVRAARPDEWEWALRVRGTGGRLTPPADGVLRVGNAGAVLRMLLALGALLPEVRFETDHPDSLGRRPNADLLDALRQLGVAVEAQGDEGRLPITLRGGGLRGGEVTVSGAHSSQFVSALLFLAPLLPDGLTITITDGVVSASFIGLTTQALAAAGISVETRGEGGDPLRLVISPGQSYSAREYSIPGDAPSAAALIAAAVALRRPLRLLGLAADDAEVGSLLAALQRMGVELSWADDGPGRALVLDQSARTALCGATIDGNRIVDSVPVLAALACLAPGQTRFERVAHLRLKESDRIGDLAAEFARAGAHVRGTMDALIVEGAPLGIPGGAEVHGHDDHRLVQALAVLACAGHDPLALVGADAVAKSYPGFFAELARLGARIQ